MSPTHRWLARLFTEFADGTLANCEARREVVIAEEWPGPDRVWIMENGIEFDQFSTFLHEDGSRSGVGLVANLRPIKGSDLFVVGGQPSGGRLPRRRLPLPEGELRP